MDYLPVFLRLRAESALVVGGGAVAARKLDWLLRAGASVTVVAPHLVAGLEQRVAAGEFRHCAETFAPHQLAGAALVVAATNDAEVNAAISRAARERRVPVNVVDAPELSSFIFPAIVDRSPLVVAVSSGGAAPVLARSVRAQIEALLPARLGMLARFIGERRQVVKRSLAGLLQRAFWERIVGGIAGSRVLAGDTAGAELAFRRDLLAWRLTASTAKSASGCGEVYLIGAGPGDPDLLTLRALQLLQQADVILYDRLIPGAILERARRDAERICVGKTSGEHAQQAHIHALLVQFARQGKRVARLKGGDPLLFGRGGEEIEVLATHGIPCIVVPGITAALGAAAAAGIPLTHRDLAHSVTFVTGHDDGILDWPVLARPAQTVVVYMGVAQLARIASQLLAAGADPCLPTALIEQATLPRQRVLRAALRDVAALAAREHVAAPALLIVGTVAAAPAADVAGRSAPP
jgi:uroporphyrin-III C-methyltransferase/precorrin-2 dehydrogenase/sirohydrochlorin ferrochelatase